MITNYLFTPVNNKPIRHKEGFYVQSAISADDFEKGMNIGIEAMNAKPDSEQQIKLYYTAANQYHFYFSIKSLQEKFERFSQPSEASSGYSRLRQLLKWCLPNANLNTNDDDLIETSIMFVKSLSLDYCYNGTPGFLAACSFYTHLAFFIGRLPKSSKLNVIDSILLISDLYKTGVELLFAAKFTKNSSKAEILNCNTDDRAKLFNDPELSHQKILDFYNDYYHFFAERHSLQILDIQVLKENALSLTGFFFKNFVKSDSSDNNQINPRPTDPHF